MTTALATPVPRSIEGVATSVALFIGWSARGPLGTPMRIASAAEYERHFGGADARSDVGAAVAHFFANGGRDAWVVRLAADDAATASAENEAMRIVASSAGAWGNRLRVGLVKRRGRSQRFRIDIREGSTRSAVVERFDDLSLTPDDARYAPAIVNASSQCVRIETTSETTNVATNAGITRSQRVALAGGSDGRMLAVGSDDFRDALAASFGSGGPVDAIDAFDLLCVPGEARPQTQALLQRQCVARRAFLIADCDADATIARLSEGPDAMLLGAGVDHAAMYAPWVLASDPMQRGAVRPYPPCGFVAGVYARTDAAHGVWKASAGAGAQLIGSSGLALAIDDDRSDAIARAGINCLRRFPDAGDVVWGARTMACSDAQNVQRKYVPVRRLALFIESSIDRGLQWVAFEPNAEALWAQVRAAVGDFLHTLWMQGALAGTTPREAYLVHCDTSTMTQADIDNGRLNVVIGVAPTRPAEFVIIRIGMWAQCATCTR